jgi:hypothetical protein
MRSMMQPSGHTRGVNSTDSSALSAPPMLTTAPPSQLTGSDDDVDGATGKQDIALIYPSRAVARASCRAHGAHRGAAC